jgi:hypothetical protein
MTGLTTCSPKTSRYIGGSLKNSLDDVMSAFFVADFDRSMHWVCMSIVTDIEVLDVETVSLQHGVITKV